MTKHFMTWIVLSIILASCVCAQEQNDMPIMDHPHGLSLPDDDECLEAFKAKCTATPPKPGLREVLETILPLHPLFVIKNVWDESMYWWDVTRNPAFVVSRLMDDLKDSLMPVSISDSEIPDSEMLNWSSLVLESPFREIKSYKKEMVTRHHPNPNPNSTIYREGLIFGSHIREIKGLTKELFADYLGPMPDFMVQDDREIHHLHYKVTVHYAKKIEVIWPFQYEIRDEEGCEFLYFDHDHIHSEKTSEAEFVSHAGKIWETSFPPGKHVIEVPVKKNTPGISNNRLQPIANSMPLIRESETCPRFPSDCRVMAEYINHLIESKQRDVSLPVPTVKKIGKEFLSESMNEPREIPLVGLAQLHRKRFLCTIHFEDDHGREWTDEAELEFDDYHLLAPFP